MWTTVSSNTKQITDYHFCRVTIDLSSADIRQDAVACQDMEDFFGGIGRSFKLLDHYDVTDPFAASSPLIMNLGVFTGTDMMTGLRTFFSGYSPLKRARNGRPLAMWSTASGDFGTRMLYAGVDEVIFLGRSPQPVYLLVRKDGDTVRMSLEDASDLIGKTTHDKIVLLAARYDDAHVAALGPAGEHWQNNYYAAIACSTGNEIETGECKPRFAGRGGMGSILGSKNLLAIVAQAPIPKRDRLGLALLEANKEISRGEGSRNYRDPKKANGGGGTWRNVAGLHPIGALPEKKFLAAGGRSTVFLVPRRYGRHLCH
jgi:aldehyde:ferredoxin oxidoreductase